MDVLASRLESGDLIICISVDRFPSVSYCFAFAEKVLNAGVSLRCLEQPYLDIRNRTGNSMFEELLDGQLSRNKLTSEGVPTVRPSGGKK